MRIKPHLLIPAALLLATLTGCRPAAQQDITPTAVPPAAAPTPIPTFTPPAPYTLENAHAWALAAGAIIPRQHNDQLNSLRSRLPPEDVERVLREDWNIADAETARSALDWLEQQGSTQEFEALLLRFSQLDRQGFDDLIVAVSDQNAQRRYRYVWENLDSFDQQTLTAWDYGRLIAVARYCYAAGYLSEAEAWEIILRAARRIQAAHTSWEDYAIHYSLGRRYWQNGDPLDQFYMNALNWLAIDPQSPWQKHPWTTPLYP